MSAPGPDRAAGGDVGALRAACEEMGAVLIRSARSSNIKERRDASTALFDPPGEMVMQAEHIPVHLGSMPAAVAGDPRRGPRAGRLVGSERSVRGRHAPARHHGDHARCCSTASLLGFAASRAHHADVGGRIPGSMPADSRTLEEEGVVIGPTRLDEATLEGAVARECASRPSAKPTCAPSWPPTGWARCA